MKQVNYPLILEPIYKERVWGGERLLPGRENIGESWVLSVRPDDDVRVTNGEYAGKKLGDLIRLHPEFLGVHSSDEDFPILIKFIDSKEALSIQVHPDDETALVLGCERGKTEMWYIINAEPDAYIYYGIRDGIDLDDLKNEVLNGDDPTVYLNKVYVRAGDCFLIAGGTPHAIGAGIYLAEIQQNCDTTFRIYDYCRLGLDGAPRALHRREAAIAIKKSLGSNERKGDRLASCEYFESSIINLDGKAELNALTHSFTSLTVISGKGRIICTDSEYHFAAGDELFIPAGREEYLLDGSAAIIKTTI